jgi:hypothetical protein
MMGTHTHDIKTTIATSQGRGGTQRTWAGFHQRKRIDPCTIAGMFGPLESAQMPGRVGHSSHAELRSHGQSEAKRDGNDRVQVAHANATVEPNDLRPAEFAGGCEAWSRIQADVHSNAVQRASSRSSSLNAVTTTRIRTRAHTHTNKVFLGAGARAKKTRPITTPTGPCLRSLAAVGSRADEPTDPPVDNSSNKTTRNPSVMHVTTSSAMPTIEANLRQPPNATF